MFTAPLLSSARAALIMAAAVLVGADGTPQPLPFAPAWTDPSLIAADDAWTGVPGVQGFLGQGITSITGPIRARSAERRPTTIRSTSP